MVSAVTGDVNQAAGSMLLAVLVVRSLGRLVGHQSLRTTMRYLHALDGAPEQAIEGLPAIGKSQA